MFWDTSPLHPPNNLPQTTLQLAKPEVKSPPKNFITTAEMLQVDTGSSYLRAGIGGETAPR